MVGPGGNFNADYYEVDDSASSYDPCDAPVDPQSVLGGSVEYRAGTDTKNPGLCILAVWAFIFACLGIIYLGVYAYLYFFG